MTVYVEPFTPAPTVFVVGCGHVGRAVVELAHWLGYRVVASDDRVELVTRELLSDADVLLPGPAEVALRAAPVTADTHVVVVTRGPEVDLDLLPRLLDTPAASIGVIGSMRRWESTREALLERGVDEAGLERISNPIGLDIGAETPREIALAILGEIVELRRTGKSPTRRRG
jgi:xanthine dehydrogenase accessory factor